MGDCALWVAEQTDDSLKALFIADAHYKNGNTAEAVGMLKAQKVRLPAINRSAEQACGRKISLPAGLADDIDAVQGMMERKEDYSRVHAKVYEIDKRHAVKGYEEYCRWRR